ncbi:uncharacterized protein LOC126895779 [Daktulosphaira vitifoliae]|uniref:uncharacterized protein LOC126895779 n=1 Tax=Daktulosphaira vitifoliae TaxID=58002 RepID=UPI0021AAEE4C|nr:uncharacterized protein LOC126895779 [Daktulosphaira vitifoliae]
MASIFVRVDVKRRKLFVKIIFSSMKSSAHEPSLLAITLRKVRMYKEPTMDDNPPLKNGDPIEFSSDDILGVMKNISLVKNGLMPYESESEQIEIGNGDTDAMFTIGDNDLSSFERDLLDNVIGMAEEEVVTQYDDTPTVKENFNKYMNKGKVLRERLQKIVSKLQNIQLKTMGKCSTQEIYNLLQSQKSSAIKNIKTTLLKVQKRQSNPFLKSLLCDEIKDGEKVFGLLESQIKTLNEDYDSEATASDSETDTLGETSEEEIQATSYPIENRNAWKWFHERAGIAYRLTWLVNVMSDMEFKINFYNEALNRYTTRSFTQDQEEDTARRVHPYEPKIQHRMLTQPPLINLAAAWKKGDKAKFNLINPCDCYGIDSCPTCISLTHHTNNSAHRFSATFHPVLSDSKNTSLNVALSNELGKLSFHQKQKNKSKSNTDFSKFFMDRSSEPSPTTRPVQPVKLQNAWPNRNDPITKFNRNQRQARKRRRMRYGKHKRSRLDDDYKYSSRRSSESICDDEDLDDVYEDDNYDSDPDYSPWFPRTGDKTYNAKREYDIDNIVIPYSIAAASRVEMVKYKEIVTPKWRVVEELDIDPTEFAASVPDPEPEVVDDLDDGKRNAHHEACEMEERKRFRTMKKQSERTHKNSGHCSSGENTSEAMSPLFENRSPMPTVEEEPDAGPSNQDWNP